VNSFRGHIILVIVLDIQSRHGRVDGNKVRLLVGIGGIGSDGSRNHWRLGGMSHMPHDPRRQMHARCGTSHSVREVDDGALRLSHSRSHVNAVISNELASDGIDMGRCMQIQRRRLNGTRCRSMVVVGSRSQLGVTGVRGREYGLAEPRDAGRMERLFPIDQKIGDGVAGGIELARW
jgi:hypothetical protein